MTSIHSKSELISPNPLDLAEMVVMDRDWSFDRPGDAELVADVAGVWCNYRVWFAWEEELGTLMLSCAIDAKPPKAVRPRICALLALVNEKLWVGHFDLCSHENTVTFRHSLLLRDGVGTSTEHLQDLLDIAINECERFYPALQAAVWGGKAPEEALQIAVFDTVAEA